MNQISKTEQKQVKAMLEVGFSFRFIARELVISKNTVMRWSHVFGVRNKRDIMERGGGICHASTGHRPKRIRYGKGHRRAAQP